MSDEFKLELTALISKHIMEIPCNTPDYLITDFLMLHLGTYTSALKSIQVGQQIYPKEQDFEAHKQQVANSIAQEAVKHFALTARATEAWHNQMGQT